MKKSDIKAILKAAEVIDKIATKYNIKGNLAQVYVEVYNQNKK